ncbi:MAG: hypothetical protein JEZ12_16040 [Desulfobacterium sp.]|nr:hypothetical protein [Desulfobacterium sp.]
MPLFYCYGFYDKWFFVPYQQLSLAAERKFESIQKLGFKKLWANVRHHLKTPHSLSGAKGIALLKRQDKI